VWVLIESFVTADAADFRDIVGSGVHFLSNLFMLNHIYTITYNLILVHLVHEVRLTRQPIVIG
jgi:hypothetical protein